MYSSNVMIVLLSCFWNKFQDLGSFILNFVCFFYLWFVLLG